MHETSAWAITQSNLPIESILTPLSSTVLIAVKNHRKTFDSI